MGLLAYGWLLEDNGHISLLPLGDNGEYKWLHLELSEQEKAFEVIKQKVVLKEIVGITLTWKDSKVGVDVLFPEENTILFSLTVNRKPLIGSEFSDVSWYLERIIPALISKGTMIEHISWSEAI